MGFEELWIWNCCYVYRNWAEKSWVWTNCRFEILLEIKQKNDGFWGTVDLAKKKKRQKKKKKKNFWPKFFSDFYRQSFSGLKFFQNKTLSSQPKIFSEPKNIFGPRLILVISMDQNFCRTKKNLYNFFYRLKFLDPTLLKQKFSFEIKFFLVQKFLNKKKQNKPMVWSV